MVSLQSSNGYLYKEKFTPVGEGGSGLKASATESLNFLVGFTLKLVFFLLTVPVICVIESFLDCEFVLGIC